MPPLGTWAAIAAIAAAAIAALAFAAPPLVRLGVMWQRMVQAEKSAEQVGRDLQSVKDEINDLWLEVARPPAQEASASLGEEPREEGDEYFKSEEDESDDLDGG